VLEPQPCAVFHESLVYLFYGNTAKVTLCL
jgi:hypothetical protein